MIGAVKVFQRHAVDLLGNILAELVGDFGCNTGHDPALDIVDQGGDQVKCCHQDDDPADILKIDPGAGPGDHTHYTFKQARDSLAKDLGAENIEDG